VNGLGTERAAADIAAMSEAGPDAILLPKVERAEDVVRIAQLMDDHGAPAAASIWAMMETPRAVLNAAAIAASHSRLEGFVMGTNDLAKDLGAALTPDRAELMASLQICLLAARAEGLVCVDGVFNAFRDAEGLRATCVQSRDLGFDGRTLIHPDQIAIANEVFAPTAAEVADAREAIEVYRASEADGVGAIGREGKLVDAAHMRLAENVLYKAALAAGEGSA
jgi:citrate lyase beta subunit